MKLAPSAVSAIAVILSQLLPMAGIELGTAELTTTIQTLVALVGGLVVYVRQILNGRSNVFGARPKA